MKIGDRKRGSPGKGRIFEQWEHSRVKQTIALLLRPLFIDFFFKRTTN